jgi:putative membrane protein
MMERPSPAPADPRIYFAAERTLLAWVRTGIAVMAFGFVVERFALFILLVPNADLGAYSSGLSTLIGAALVILGAAAIVAGTLEYRRYCKTLRPIDLPTPHATRLPQILAWSIVVLAGALLLVLLA